MLKYVIGAYISLVVFVFCVWALGTGQFQPRPALSILASVEHKGLDQAMQDFATEAKIDLSVTYADPVAMGIALRGGLITDAVWPANSMALTEAVDRFAQQSPMIADPVVFAVTPDVADTLGWSTQDPVAFDNIFKAAEEGAFALTFPSASRTTSGALAYFSALHAVWKSTDGLTPGILDSGLIKDDMSLFFAQVDAAPDQPDWLNTPQSKGRVQAIFALESQVLRHNADTETPLVPIYLADGAMVADAPLALVEGSADSTQQAFDALSAFLSDGAIQNSGRRPAAGLSEVAELWQTSGIASGQQLSQLPLPDAALADQLLALYQTELRKPSLTVWLMDVSDTVDQDRLEAEKKALSELFDPGFLEVHNLQPTAKDISIVIPYHANVSRQIVATGDRKIELEFARKDILDQTSQSGPSDLYFGLFEAIAAIAPHVNGHALTTHLPSIIALPGGAPLDETREAYFALRAQTPFAADIPVHIVPLTSDVDPALQELADQTGGTIYKGSVLSTAMKQARGQN